MMVAHRGARIYTMHRMVLGSAICSSRAGTPVPSILHPGDHLPATVTCLVICALVRSVAF
jgi:hypothetical protein